MIVKKLSKRKIDLVHREAHQTAWDAASLIGEHYRFSQGRVGGPGLYVKHGYMDPHLDFVPISQIVTAAPLRNKHALRETTPLSVVRMLRQSFAGHKFWKAGETELKVRDFIAPVQSFLQQYHEHVDVFAGVYENNFTGTNVFGTYIMLKGVELEDRFSWEITIDDADLHEAGKPRPFFR